MELKFKELKGDDIIAKDDEYTDGLMIWKKVRASIGRHVKDYQGSPYVFRRPVKKLKIG